MSLIEHEAEKLAALQRIESLLSQLLVEMRSHNYGLLTKKQVMEKFGWSQTTIGKKMVRGELHPLRDAHGNVRFHVDDIVTAFKGGREGNRRKRLPVLAQRKEAQKHDRPQADSAVR